MISNGHAWQSNRRFSIRALKDFGMGKSRLAGSILAQAKNLLQELEKVEAKPAKIDMFINVAVVNVIFNITTGIVKVKSYHRGNKYYRG